MGSPGVQVVCVALGIMGLVGTIVCCAIPRWKVSSFVGSNIVTAQVTNSSLNINRCTVVWTNAKVWKMHIDASLSPQSTEDGRTHIVIRDFYNPLVPQKKELGACIFVGWAGGVLLVLGGGLLCCFSRNTSSSSGGAAKYYTSHSKVL